MYNWSVFIITASSLAGLVIVVTSYDPYTVGDLIKSLFYSSLFLAVSGLVMSFKIIFKKWIPNKVALSGKTNGVQNNNKSSSARITGRQ